MLLVLLERFAGEPEVLGPPVKVETSATVVSGSSTSENKQRRNMWDLSSWLELPASRPSWLSWMIGLRDILVSDWSWIFSIFYSWNLLKTLDWKFQIFWFTLLKTSDKRGFVGLVWHSLAHFLTFPSDQLGNDLVFIGAKGHLVRSWIFIQNNLRIAVRLPATELVQLTSTSVVVLLW